MREGKAAEVGGERELPRTTRNTRKAGEGFISYEVGAQWKEKSGMGQWKNLGDRTSGRYFGYYAHDTYLGPGDRQRAEASRIRHPDTPVQPAAPGDLGGAAR